MPLCVRVSPQNAEPKHVAIFLPGLPRALGPGVPGFSSSGPRGRVRAALAHHLSQTFCPPLTLSSAPCLSLACFLFAQF